MQDAFYNSIGGKYELRNGFGVLRPRQVDGSFYKNILGIRILQLYFGIANGIIGLPVSLPK